MNKIRRPLVILLALLSLTTVGFAEGEWVTMQGGHFLNKRANDGDSFHVSINGKEYIFRLYFVDAPETDTEFRDRVEEQAKYFGDTIEQNRQIGDLAKAFTREKLSHPFVVRTRFQDAMGRSRLQRFYALVQTFDGDLGEELVENGLARIHGLQASPDGVTSARQEWQKLSLLQQKARRAQIGGWGAAVGRMMTRAEQPQDVRPPDAFNTFFHPAQTPNVANATPAASPLTILSPAENSALPNDSKLDINTASEAELENISGIGPATAQRIIAARPFKSADDLRNVKGIGDVRYEKLRPYFN